MLLASISMSILALPCFSACWAPAVREISTNKLQTTSAELGVCQGGGTARERKDVGHLVDLSFVLRRF